MLQAIRESFVKRSATASQKYRDLVEAIAGGKAIPSTAADIAIAAGKSVTDLENDVGIVTSRNEAEADLQRADALQADIDRLSAECHAASAHHDELVKRHRREMEGALSRIAEARGARGAASQKQSRLRDKATAVLSRTPDPTAD